MSTLIISGVDGGKEIDRVTLANDKLSYQTGAARDMFDNLVNLGYTPAEAFNLRTGWSNGYVLAQLAG
jgi:hypothetical protein